MFRERPPGREPATRALIALNVAVFLFELLAGRAWILVIHAFGLTAEGLRDGALWQLVTYQFLHANELHILVNMVGLWFAGRELERALGTGRFLLVYLAGGVAGGLCQVLLAPSGAPLIGASGSVCAVLLALTTLFPRAPIVALLFFVLPVRMRARTLGFALVAVSIGFWLSGWQPEVGHLAHLGGFAAGWAFGRAWRSRFGEDSGAWSYRPVTPTAPPPLPDEITPWAPATSVDAVLAKVLTHGIDSLTREERRLLEESRRPQRRW